MDPKSPQVEVPFEAADEDDWDDEEGFDDAPDLTPRERAEMILPGGEIGPPLPRGAPVRYECDCLPAGRLEIKYNRSASPAERWQLSLEGILLARFADHLDAMVAVCHFKTGSARWDEFEGTILAPRDSSDWDARDY